MATATTNPLDLQFPASSNPLTSGTSPTADGSTPIPTSSVTGINPLQLPKKTDPSGLTPATSATATVQALNGNNGQTISPSQGALLTSQDSGAKTAQDTYNSDKTDVNSMINSYLGMGQDQLNQENAQGVPQLQKTSNQLTQQYLAQQNLNNQQYNSIYNDPSKTMEQKAAAINAATQQNGYNLTNIGIQQSIAQNDYNTAEQLIQHRIQIQYGALKDSIGFKQAILSQDQNILSQKQTQSFQADLQVQQQMYTQGTYYSQLNASSGIQMLKDATANHAPQEVLDKMSSLLAQGASAGDVASAGGQFLSSINTQNVNEMLKQATANKAPSDVIQRMSQLISQGASAGEVAAAGGQFLASGNYPMTWNPKTEKMEPYNQGTGQFVSDNSPIPPNSQSYNLADNNSTSTTTSSSGTVYNWGNYNGNPQYGLKVAEATSTITSKYGNIDSPKTAQMVLSNMAPDSKLTGSMVYNAAINAGIDPTILMGHINQESGIGISNVAQKNNNYGGFTWTPGETMYQGVPVTQGSARPASEGGYYMKFSTPQDGITAQARKDAHTIGKPPATNMGQIPSIQGKIDFINQVKATMPSSIKDATTFLDQTGDGIIDKSLLVDPYGAPSNYSLNKANEYQAQGFRVIGHEEVLTLQAANTLLTNVNNLDAAWQKIAPQGMVDRFKQELSNPFNLATQSDHGKDIIAYNTMFPSAYNNINSVIDTKRISSLTEKITNDGLPVVTSFNPIGSLETGGAGAVAGFGLGSLVGGIGAIPGAIGGAIGGAALGSAKGDTLSTGQRKLDALRMDANTTIKQILNDSQGGVLSTDYVNVKKPDGTIGQIPKSSLSQALQLGAIQI